MTESAGSGSCTIRTSGGRQWSEGKGRTVEVTWWNEVSLGSDAVSRWLMKGGVV